MCRALWRAHQNIKSQSFREALQKKNWKSLSPNKIVIGVTIFCWAEILRILAKLKHSIFKLSIRLLLIWRVCACVHIKGPGNISVGTCKVFKMAWALSGCLAPLDGIRLPDTNLLMSGSLLQFSAVLRQPVTDFGSIGMHNQDIKHQTTMVSGCLTPPKQCLAAWHNSDKVNLYRFFLICMLPSIWMCMVPFQLSRYMQCDLHVAVGLPDTVWNNHFFF